MPDLILTRAAARSTVDVEARTVEAVLASETPVRRKTWTEGTYDEVLRCTPEAVDLSRSDALSLLDSHDAWSLGSRLGTVTNVRFEGRKLVGTLVLGKSQRADELLTDLSNGHRLGVSIGYRVEASDKVEAFAGGVATVTATRWTFLEASIVAIPADPVAQTRSLSTEDTMPESFETDTRHQPNNIINERTRSKQIRELGKRSGMDQVMIDNAIDDGTTVDAFRAAMLDRLVDRQSQAPTFPHVETGGMDGNRTRAEAMADALLTRVDSSHKPKPDSAQYRGLTLVEIARECLTASGEFASRGMSPLQVFERALHGKTDFPIIINQVGQTVLAQRYLAVQSPLKMVANRSLAATFKPKTSIQLSSFSDLEEVTEHGEYTRGTFKEAAESYRIRSFGKVFGITFEALTNDELGAFYTVISELADTAARLEADILANLLNDNPLMADGHAVFHTLHDNLLSGAGLSGEALDVARLKLRQQKGLAGELINVTPKFLVVGIENETVGERVLSAVQANQTDNVNVFAGKLQLVVDRRVAGKTWYLAADPALTAGLEYANLSGYETPQIMQREGFDTDGIETRVSHRFGAGWIDWRGWVKNPGA